MRFGSFYIRTDLLKWIVFSCILLVISFLQIVCNNPTNNTAQVPLDSATYVGIEVCANCHGQIYETFKHTGMGQSFDMATSDKSAAQFKDFSVYHAPSNMHYTAFWKEKAMYIKEYRLENADTTYQFIKKIDYVIGSGQHTNSHLFNQNGFVYQAPLTWYAQAKKWDLPPGFTEHNSRFSRMIDVECMSCHNAMPVVDEQLNKKFVSIGEGIDCERCHGPGSAHVKYWESPAKEKTAQHGKYIINPGKLTHDRLTDLCQRCHLQGNNVLKEGKSFTDFKPGMKLAEVFEIYLPKYQNGEGDFDMANHAARLQKSACFVKSKGKLTCISCHNPHVSVKQTNTIKFNETCNNCHQEKKCIAPQDSLIKHKYNCVKCHMPSSGTVDIPHVTVHDHFISKKRMGGDKNNGKLVGLYAVNNPQPEQKYLAKAYLTYFEKFDPNPIYRQKALEIIEKINAPELWVHYHYQSQNYAALLQWATKIDKNADDLTCYRLGKAYDATGNYQQAKLWYFKTIMSAEVRPEYYVAYISMCFKLNDLDEANRAINKSLPLFTDNAMLWNAQGYYYHVLNNYNEAKKAYVKSLALNPDLLPTLENMAQLYYQLNDKPMTKKYIGRILQIEATHAKALALLKKLN